MTAALQNGARRNLKRKIRASNRPIFPSRSCYEALTRRRSAQKTQKMHRGEKERHFRNQAASPTATIIYPFPPFSREGKVRHRNKAARPRGRDALRQYVYGEWLAEYRLLLLEKQNLQQKRQRRPEFAALEK